MQWRRYSYTEKKEITLITKHRTYANNVRVLEKKAGVKLVYIFFLIIIHLYLVYWTISIIWLQYQFYTDQQKLHSIAN